MASDYWQQRFREADERAALLAEATVPELVAMYHASGEDIDASSLRVEALQRRPHRDVRRTAWRELRASFPARRAFAVTLLSLSCRTTAHRRSLSRVFVALLHDQDSGVVRASLHAIDSQTVRANDRQFGARIIEQGDALYSDAWTDHPLPDLVPAQELAFLIHHQDAEVRNVLAHSFGCTGTLEATAILLALTWDTDLDVRAHAAFQLGRRYVGGSIEEPVRRLCELCESPFRYIRACAITALVELGQHRAAPLIETELLGALESGESRMCVWPLRHLVSRKPHLVSEQMRELLRKRAHQWPA